MVGAVHCIIIYIGSKVELPGCKGMWTVYHKSTRSHNPDSSKIASEDDEYHAYLIISLEARTMVSPLTCPVYKYLSGKHLPYLV